MSKSSDVMDSLSTDAFAACLERDLTRGQFFHADAGKWSISAHMFRYRDGLLGEWLDWVSPKHAVWNAALGYDIPLEWVETSRRCHEAVVRRVLARPYESQKYRHIDFYNATDYLFQTLLGPSGKVLDFGAGYGRQAFLWTGLNERVAYAAIDGIEGSYLLQNRVFQSLPDMEFREYMGGPDGFSLPPDNRGKVIAHLPTWRMDLLPDGYFDLIVCCQVLQEIPGRLVQPILDCFRRVIRPGGKLYIRDVEWWRPSHRFRIGRYLLKQGWRLAFRHPGVDTRDIHSIPRIWTFTGEDTTEIASAWKTLRRSTRPMLRNRIGVRDLLDCMLPI